MKLQMFSLIPAKPKTTLHAVFADGTRVAMRFSKFTQGYRYCADSTKAAFPLSYAKERALEEGAIRFERI